ncbi:MAG: energy-coupling factor transporter transmembrane protein EcfT [Actinobacteria bacterium]|nr:energy-coupling factor transporter transmembrane protein EcfT [Actinomycetota bacterium]
MPGWSRRDGATVREPRGRLPRQLHPGAWWLWALGLVAVASRTWNPLLLLLVIVVAGYVVAARRTDAPWARSYAVFLRLGLVVLTVRLVFQVVLGVPQGTTELFTLPSVALPDWAAGVSLGGPVTLESVVAAATDGLRLATILACIGAANALANPKRLLAAMPAALYEIGVAVVVSLSFAPALVGGVQRVRAARRLRGRPDRGVRSMVSVALPVLEDALERSLALAAAMDSRGYGRRAEVPRRTRRLTAVLTLGGLVGMCLGLYALLDAATSPLVGTLLLAVGVLASGIGLRLAGRRAVRSRYRPDPWAAPEHWTAAAGLVAAALVVVAGIVDPAGLSPSVVPLTAPPLPPLATVGVLVALLPAWLTPPPALRRPDPAPTAAAARPRPAPHPATEVDA